jgi:F-type H+-transporting ATPase subunit delta
MSATRIANRYAKALYRLIGTDPKNTKTCLEQLQTARALFDIEPSAKVLMSPVMPQDLKKKLFDAALTAANGSDVLRAFIGALVAAGRVDIYPAFVDRFARILNEAAGIVDADVITATTIDPVVLGNLTSSLERILKTKIQVSQQVDPELLGGFVVRLGNRMIDLSLKTKLDALSKSAAL